MYSPEQYGGKPLPEVVCTVRLAIGFLLVYADGVHSRDLLLVFSNALVLQNPKLSFP